MNVEVFVMRLIQFLAFLAAVLLPTVAAAGDKNGAGSTGFYWNWGSLVGACNGDCATTAFAGQQTSQTMQSVIGIADFTQGEFGFVPVVPIWEWPWDDSGFFAATYSRRIGSFGHAEVGEVVSFEAEMGIGQRWGIQTETELWGAIYVRWHLFPWNHRVKTTIGISSGLNWASGISDWEVHRSGNEEGSQLLHYLSPEITLAWPKNPNFEVLARFHHRSGGSDMFGPNSIFNNTGSGSQYFLLGTRYRF